jgi:iron complex outermembrane receptor protein
LLTLSLVTVVTAPARGAGPESEAIVIGGERRQPQAPGRSPHVSGSVVESERLAQPGMSAAEALRDAPGIQIVQLGGFGAPASLSLRGATAAQTPVYLGAVRINDDVGGTADLGEVPLAMVERIEVYRSHAPLFADQLGIGGAVLFEPRRADRNENHWAAMVGSAGARSAAVYAARADEGGGVLAGVELSASDNGYAFRSGNGTQFVTGDDGVLRLSNADVRNTNLWLSAQQAIGSAKLRLLYHHADRELGAPKLALTASRLARVALRRDLFALSSTIPVEAWEGALELVTSGVASETEIVDPLSELSLTSKRSRTPAERLEQSALARQSFGALRLVEQLSVSEERLRRFETPGVEPIARVNAQRLTARAAVGFVLTLFGPLRAEGTLAWSCFGTGQNRPPGCDEQAANGRLGLAWQRAGYELYASVGRYQRPPTLAELYGASLVLRGNPELAPELGHTAEAGARYQVHGLQRRLAWVDAAGFVRLSEQLITYVRAAQGYLHPMNNRRSRTLGAELSAGVAPFAFLDFEGSVSLLDPRDTSPNRQTRNDLLPYSRATLSGLLALHVDWEHRSLDSLWLGLRGFHQSSRYADPAGLGVIPEQTSFDVETAASGLSRSLIARLRLTNLFATRRFDSVGFVLPGRSLFFSLEAKP